MPETAVSVWGYLYPPVLDGQSLTFQVGDSRLYVPAIDVSQPEPTQFAYMDWSQPTDGLHESNEVSSWPGFACGHYYDWLAPSKYRRSGSFGLGVMVSREGDAWEIELDGLDAESQPDIYSIPDVIGSTWPISPDFESRLTELPNSLGTADAPIELADIRHDNAVSLESWPLRPLFMILLEPMGLRPSRGVYWDNDLDGVDDTWEKLHFGNKDRDFAGDADGDGQLDGLEALAGTDPNDPNSGVEHGFSEDLTSLTWHYGQGMKSWPEVSTDLEHWSPVAESDIINQNSTECVIRTSPDRFYRLRFQELPSL